MKKLLAILLIIMIASLFISCQKQKEILKTPDLESEKPTVETDLNSGDKVSKNFIVTGHVKCRTFGHANAEKTAM